MEFFTGIAQRGRGDYFRMLEPWTAAFGPDRVSVRNFDALASGGIVSDFFVRFLPDVEVPLALDAYSDRRNTMAGLKHLVAVSIVLRSCRERIGPAFELPSSSAIRIAQFFRNRSDVQKPFSVLSYEDAVAVARRFADTNQRLANLSSEFRASGGFPFPNPQEYCNYVDIGSLDGSILDAEENQFVNRMALEISRVVKI
jgi:hypothetical protein